MTLSCDCPIGIPKKQQVLLTEQQICFAFVRFVLLFFATFFAVLEQLRREMTKFLVYLTTGKARRKIFFLSFTVRSLRRPTAFPSVRYLHGLE